MSNQTNSPLNVRLNVLRTLSPTPVVSGSQSSSSTPSVPDPNLIPPVTPPTQSELRQELFLSMVTAVPTLLLSFGYFISKFLGDTQVINDTECTKDEVDDTNTRFLFWLVVNVIRCVCLNSTLAYYWFNRIEITTNSEAGKRVANLQSVSFLWVFIGVWFLLTATCAEVTAFKFVLSIILIECFVLFLPCVVLLLLLPLVFFCLPCVIRALVMINQNKQGAAKKFIESLPTSTYAEHKGDQDVCAICLVTFESTDVVRILPCNGAHYFHTTCVDNWLILNATCPCCREDIKPGVRSLEEGAPVDLNPTTTAINFA